MIEYVYAFLGGMGLYFFLRVIATGFFTVRPDQRAALTSFGRAQRLGQNSEASAEVPQLDDEDAQRYKYPEIRIIGPGGPYFKWPWQRLYKVCVSTEAVDLTWDPSKVQGTIEAVTKDNLTTGVNGQLRYRVNENCLYAYIFGVQAPLQHVMGYFISVLRERISNFVDPKGGALVADGDISNDQDQSAMELSEGVSINDLRKNLPLLNDYMEQQCKGTMARYGIELDAALITEIDPPAAVDQALSAINSTRNQVAADISTAKANSEQQITMSKRAVEIATNNAQAEVAPLNELAGTLAKIKSQGGSQVLQAYLRNMRVPLLSRARRVMQLGGPKNLQSEKRR